MTLEFLMNDVHEFVVGVGCLRNKLSSVSTLGSYTASNALPSSEQPCPAL